MPKLSIRNANARIGEDLKDKALQEDSSLEAELQAILDKAGATLTPDEFFKGAALIRKTTRGKPQTDSAIIQRQMRDERAGLLKK